MMASGSTSIRVMGDRRIVRKLEALGVKAAKKVASKALRKGSRIVAQKVKAKVPRRTGLLRASIGVKRTHYRKDGSIVDTVGSRTRFKSKVQSELTGKLRRYRPHFVAHLVEKGTRPHRLGRSENAARHPGTTARPFLAPAWKATRDKAEITIRRELSRLIREAGK